MYEETGNYGILDSVRLAACNSEIKICSCKKFILSQFRTFLYFKKKLKLYDFKKTLFNVAQSKL